MLKNSKKEKFSLRKYKNGRTDSKVIGAVTILGFAMLTGGGTALANVTSGDRSETTIVMDLERVPSSAKTTFTDDQNPTKKVTVDAVIGKVVSLPTKANENTGNPDGTDTVNFKTKATVNYLLEDDNSKLQDSKTVEGGSGTINTPYDRKGIASDIDGKDYRESTVEKTGTIYENTGREFHLEANNKAYSLVRSEVIDSDKATYEKTHFNDIEAPVSPEGMHNNLGEINYGKITGKVYLVEETSNGQYGKFVEATNINSDDEAVEAWRNGQATAKDFTKENVTLQKGDTILVLDRDTYAHGSGKRTVNTINYRREKVPATPEYNRVESSEEIKDVNAYPSYALFDENVRGRYVAAGVDRNFGTSDDGEVTFNGEQYLHYYHGPKLENSLPEVKDTPELDFSKSSLNEIMRYIQSEIFGVLEYFDYYAKTDAERQLIQGKRTKLEQNIADTIQMIKNENISLAAAKPDDRYTSGLVFYSPDREKLTALKKQIESAENLLDEIMFTLNTREEDVEQYDNLKNVKKITKEILYYEAHHKELDGYRHNYPKFSHRTIISYHKDAVPEHYSDWKIVYPEIEGIEHTAFANKGKVTVSDDLNRAKVVLSYSSTEEREFEKQDVSTKVETDYVTKELITPVRAYKVMEDGGPVVNHYYRMVTSRAMIPSHVRDEKVGTLTVQYVSNTGEKLRSDVVYEVPYEIRKIYDVVSGKTKVGEESVVEKLTPVYDTTPERLDTIIADKTGFTYGFDGLALDSAPETSVFDKPQMIVKYVYRLVSKEEPNPVEKEVKGSVVVKYVDAEGNEIKPAETLVKDAILRTTYTYTTKSGDKVVSTRDEVRNWLIPDYNAKDKWFEKITASDGKNYNYHGIYAVSDRFNNTTAETGKVVEGITTIVYQYDLVKPSREVPIDSPTKEVPEYEGGVSPIEPPTKEVPEYEGGVSPIEPPTKEVPEYEGGVSSIEPPIKEVPEYEGGVSVVAPPILNLPEYKGGASLILPPVLEVPEYEGGLQEAVTPSFNAVERPTTNVDRSGDIPNPRYQLQDLPTIERLEESVEQVGIKNIKKSEVLPNTGSGTSNTVSLGFMIMLSGIAMAVKKRQK